MATNTVRARLDWGLVMRKADLPPRVLAGLKHEFERPNPKFFKAQAMGYWVGNIPRVIRAWEEDERFLVLPRAAAPVVRAALESTQMELEVVDDTVTTEPAGLKLRDSELYPHQETATGAVLGKGGGIVTGPCGCGKALAHGETVLLARGRCAIEQVGVGDMVAGTDGRFYPVTGVFPQGVRPIYRVTFTDLTHVDCDGDHLWTFIRRRDDAREVTITTKTLAASRLRGSSGRVFYLPRIDPVRWPGPDDNLPLDPYLLGALLGDGDMSTGQVMFTTADSEIFEFMRLPSFHRFKDTHNPHSGKAKTYRLARTCSVARSNISKSVFNLLGSIGLAGVKSHGKFIPDRYQHAAPDARLALLQGLFDTDGAAIRSGTVDYSTVSSALADDVASVVRSLGGTCTSSTRTTTCNGREFLSHRLYIKLPAGMVPFRLSRKVAVFASGRRQREPYRAVVSVERVGNRHATCISVASPDRLFLTGDYIPTHNTVFLLAAIAKLDQRAIVVVHNGALMNQWVAAVGEWFGIAPGTVGGGRKMDVNRPVVVAMQQSLARLAKMGSPPAWTDKFGVLAGDEVHHWAASTFQAVGRMFRARHFIGVSADERRKDGLDFLVHWTFGDVVHAINRDDLESVGRLVPIRMYVVPTSYQDELYLETVGNDESPDWVGMVSRMMDVRRTAGLERAKVVWKVVERIVKDVPGARVLVLNDRVEACRMMVEQFGMMGLRAGLLIGGQENKKELERTDRKSVV